ncbi:MAG: hypothetical protein COY02_02560, partial [Parcubacteria group bacterium CG_4_10_14_0_2_um_filter_41_6]
IGAVKSLGSSKTRQYFNVTEGRESAVDPPPAPPLHPSPRSGIRAISEISLIFVFDMLVIF